MIQYERYGQGEGLVLVHGSPGNSRSWKGVGEKLFGNFDILAVNLPGYESSKPPPRIEPVETAGLARQVEEVMQLVDGPVALAAHSYGANVALHVALRSKTPIERLVLFEPVSVNVLRLVGEDTLFEDTKAVFDNYIQQSQLGEELAVRTMVDFWFGAGAFDKLPDAIQSYLRLWSPKNVSEVQASFREDYTLQELARISIPVHVVYGTRSPKATYAIAAAICDSVPDGHFIPVQDADHNLLATHPDVVAAIIGNGAPA